MLDAQALQIIQTIVLVISAGFTLLKLGRAIEKFEQIGNRQASEITALKDGQKTMSQALTDLAVQKNRMDAQAERLNRLETHLDELRRGEGYIFPLEHLEAGHEIARRYEQWRREKDEKK